MIRSKSALAGILVFAFAAVSMPVTAQAQDDVTICRGAGFYQTHSGEEKDGANIAQEIIDAADGIFVCGEAISRTTEIGGLDSVLEGLCVRTQGVEQRQLYRQLQTAQMNCLVSEGADCDEITGRFIDVDYSDCDALCAGEPVVDGPTEQECIEKLDCFNRGNRIIDGVCIKGTCDDDGETLCGSDEDCGEDGDCVRFEDSCRNSQFCSEDLESEVQICPKKGPASSPKICKQARKNQCTIDDVECYRACDNGDACVAACEATPGCEVEVACAEQFPCLEVCLTGGFGDGTPCGCEPAWWVFCNDVTDNDGDLLMCFLAYPEVQFLGFCQECGDDPIGCPFLD